MIRVNGRAARYGEVWYGEEPPRVCGVDILVYRQRPAPLKTKRHVSFLTVVTDLTIEEDAIFRQFARTCRNEIRRAQNSDGLELEFISAPQSALGEFYAFYDAFAREKALEPCDRQWLAAACRAGQLLLSSARQNGETLVWHAYLLSGTTARLHDSASCFRSRESDYRTLIGRANRWLHWQDMLRLKQMGLERYDWGGLFEDDSTPERAGINSFKKHFGGRQERTYDCTVPVTLRGRIYLPLRDAWRRWHRTQSVG